MIDILSQILLYFAVPRHHQSSCWLGKIKHIYQFLPKCRAQRTDRIFCRRALNGVEWLIAIWMAWCHESLTKCLMSHGYLTHDIACKIVSMLWHPNLGNSVIMITLWWRFAYIASECTKIKCYYNTGFTLTLLFNWFHNHVHIPSSVQLRAIATILGTFQVKYSCDPHF